MSSERTTKFRRIYWLLATICFLLNVGPFAVYSIKALIESDLTHEKVALSMTVFIVAIMTIISLVNKVAMRSKIWVVLIGIYVCLDYILTPLIIIAVCQILDEMLFSPLRRSYKTKLTINKEMDKRI